MVSTPKDPFADDMPRATPSGLSLPLRPARTGGLDERVDPLSATAVVVASSRQGRPNLPSSGCPFCPGGIEAPEPYDVRWFPNRWPALPDDRCEVLLFSPIHDASLGSLGPAGLGRVIDLWQERTEAHRRRGDVGYVLLFENRGREVGATIPHPHGQLYAFPEVPIVPARELAAPACEICVELSGSGPAGPSHDSRVVVAAEGWRAWTVWAPSWPYELLLAPEAHLADLVHADGHLDGLARTLGVALSALDRLFDAPMPYMLWVHQRPVDGGAWPTAHLHLHVAPLWRAKGVPRYVAAGELGSGVMFNPVSPEAAVEALRATIRQENGTNREDGSD